MSEEHTDDPMVIWDRYAKYNQRVKEALQGTLDAYNQLAKAEIEAAKISADLSNTPLERAEAETTADIQLKRASDWKQLLRQRVEERAAFETEYDIEHTRE